MRTGAEKPPRGRERVTARTAGALAWAAGLGFGPLGVYGTAYFARHHTVWHFMGFPTYGEGPFESMGMTTSVALLTGFDAICAAEVVVGSLLWAGRPNARWLSFTLLPLEVAYWIGFALPVGPVLGIMRTAAVVASMRAARVGSSPRAPMFAR